MRGAYGTIKELAKAKGLGKTYVSQGLRLTLLAPEVVGAILFGRPPAGLQLDDLLEGFALGWNEQHIGGSCYADHQCVPF